MQRIDFVNNPEGKAKMLLDNVRHSMGGVPNIIKVLANAPAALDAYLAFNEALSHGKLSSELREQLAIAIAAFNGCGYCAAAHTFIGRKAGIDAAELQANLQGVSMDDKTQAAITFAFALLEKRGRVSDETVQTIRSAGYTDEEIIEILAHVALNSFTNYFNETAQTELDFPAVDLDKASNAA